MQDKERNDLISVLGLDVDADTEKDSYIGCKEVTEKKRNFIDTNTEENAVDEIDNGKFASTHVSDSDDDDLKIVAVKKRKRSPSLESSTESKRKELKLVHNFVKDYEEIVINEPRDDQILK